MIVCKHPILCKAVGSPPFSHRETWLAPNVIGAWGVTTSLPTSQVTIVGWLGSSWQQPASPQRGGLGSEGVALRVSTPTTPEL